MPRHLDFNVDKGKIKQKKILALFWHLAWSRVCLGWTLGLRCFVLNSKTHPNMVPSNSLGGKHTRGNLWGDIQHQGSPTVLTDDAALCRMAPLSSVIHTRLWGPSLMTRQQSMASVLLHHVSQFTSAWIRELCHHFVMPKGEQKRDPSSQPRSSHNYCLLLEPNPPSTSGRGLLAWKPGRWVFCLAGTFCFLVGMVFVVMKMHFFRG